MTANTAVRRLAQAARIKATMQLICLTDPDNKPVWIAPRAVVSLRAVREHERPVDEAQTFISLSGSFQYVKEALEDVVLKVNTALRED